MDIICLWQEIIFKLYLSQLNFHLHGVNFSISNYRKDICIEQNILKSVGSSCAASDLHEIKNIYVVPYMTRRAPLPLTSLRASIRTHFAWDSQP